MQIKTDRLIADDIIKKLADFKKSQLSFQLLAKVFSYLTGQQLVNVALVCSRFQRIVQYVKTTQLIQKIQFSHDGNDLVDLMSPLQRHRTELSISQIREMNPRLSRLLDLIKYEGQGADSMYITGYRDLFLDVNFSIELWSCYQQSLISASTLFPLLMAHHALRQYAPGRQVHIIISFPSKDTPSHLNVDDRFYVELCHFLCLKIPESLEARFKRSQRIMNAVEQQSQRFIISLKFKDLLEDDLSDFAKILNIGLSFPLGNYRFQDDKSSKIMILPSFNIFHQHLRLLNSERGIPFQLPFSLLLVIGDLSYERMLAFQNHGVFVVQIGLKTAPTPDRADGVSCCSSSFTGHDTYHVTVKILFGHHLQLIMQFEDEIESLEQLVTQRQLLDSRGGQAIKYFRLRVFDCENRGYTPYTLKARDEHGEELALDTKKGYYKPNLFEDIKQALKEPPLMYSSANKRLGSITHHFFHQPHVKQIIDQSPTFVIDYDPFAKE